MSSVAPSSRPIQPCLFSVFEGNTGAEYSVWAHMDRSRQSQKQKQTQLPNLVTAQGSSLCIYQVDEATGKLRVQHRFAHLQGTVCFLERLQTHDGDEPDALVIGFAGHPRLSLVTLTQATTKHATLTETLCSDSHLLLASTLIDLTHALLEASMGSVTLLEQDLKACVQQQSKYTATLAVVLGGGAAVACLQLHYQPGGPGWHAPTQDPYLLPLVQLRDGNHGDTSSSSPSLSQHSTPSSTSSLSHGWGDILSCCFLKGYQEATLVLLHSHASPGRTWEGRLGRPKDSSNHGTKYGLSLTCVSVSVRHAMCAVLWRLEGVLPADAYEVVAAGKRGCLVISVNTLSLISLAGRLQHVLAVNGWARSTAAAAAGSCTNASPRPNPSPLPKLSIQLDAARLCFVQPDLALLALRRGPLYLLQIHQSSAQQLSLVPLSQTLPSHVSSLVALPFSNLPKGSGGLWSDGFLSKDGDKLSVATQQHALSMGLLFGGSRLGDSTLLGYALEKNVEVVDQVKEEGWNGKKPKLEPKDTNDDVGTSFATDSEYESILQMEEEALYAPTNGRPSPGLETMPTIPDVIPPSEDEAEDSLAMASMMVTLSSMPMLSKKRARPRLTHMTVVRSLVALDSITALGPIGPGCEGPLSSPLAEAEASAAPYVSDPLEHRRTVGGTAQIYPCGYGSSGGLAILTVPGRDDRVILAEADCLNMQCLFSLPSRGLVLMGRMAASGGETAGVSVLRVDTTCTASTKQEESDDKSFSTTDMELSEVDLDEWCNDGTSKDQNKSVYDDAYAVLTTMKLLGSAELDDEHFVLLVASKVQNTSDEMGYAIVVLTEASNGKLQVVAHHELFDTMSSSIRSATRLFHHADDDTTKLISVGCVWSSGNATVSTVGLNGVFKSSVIRCTSNSDVDENAEFDEESFYKNDRVTAVDIFAAPEGTFDRKAAEVSSVPPSSNASLEDAHGSDIGDEDAELYGIVSDDSTTSHSPNRDEDMLESDTGPTENSQQTVYVAACRQSGVLEIFAFSDLMHQQQNPHALWYANGCGQGVSAIEHNVGPSWTARHPRMHQVVASEIRFFYAGPSTSETFPRPSSKLCFAVETSFGDTHLYQHKPHDDRFLMRVPMRLSCRTSQEQVRHQAKLRRKGIIGKTEPEQDSFRYNRLHPFEDLSGQDGLFAATARPMWIVSERDDLNVLWHRSRLCAPAGGRPHSVPGFCFGLKTRGASGDQYFMTLHERIGRVGSQRLTLFRGISDVISSLGFLPGGGMCVEKILLGVTVHSIQLINDASVSSGVHPLYAALISRELEVDQSHLNDDGLTPEERQRRKDEKEAELVKRQVEADLGGFDLEQEWVEEIERENCFEIDRNLGGAPPIHKSAYAVWIVDAADKWNVVDSFQLNEFEHGLTMQVMSLSEVNEEPGSSSSAAIGEENYKDVLFVTVGTGIVDADGEDVAGKGRVLLFELTKRNKGIMGSNAVDLNFVYEKDIWHGPVTGLSCLSCEGRKRLVISAGADVNVEQWGNEKLTQVGFFRANMQILDIMLFKTFFLLSDAYDSLYFLVWRESDKSLTLLAKDYEPIPVFAAGLISRGGSMSFVCHDDRQNLQFFQYAPGDPLARGGNKLVCRSDIHIGSQTVDIQSHPCRSSLLVNSATPRSTIEALKQQDTFFGRTDDDQRLGVHFGTSDGGFLSVVPLSEPVYWRLTALQSVMANALESDCALSQRAWRLYRRTPRRGGCRNNDRNKGVIDGDLVIQFADLSLPDQEDLASAIGTTVELILDNLVELQCASTII